MSKRSKFGDNVAVLDEAEGTVAEPIEEARAAPRYRVSLRADTPLAHPTLDVEAKDEADAWQKFQAANGISESTCPREIVRL